MNKYLALAVIAGLLAASDARAALPGQPDNAATLPGLAITIDVLANDGLSGAIRSKALTQPMHGTTRWVGNLVVYTPASGFHGTDSFRYSAIARGGRAANQKVTVNVDAANGSAITLIGRAKAGVPLANAAITADVGTLHYATQANAQGDYTLEITGVNDAMVSLRAQGSGAQSGVMLRSTLGELSRLATEAGDGVLTRVEDNQVQVTELSSALAYTLEYANGGVAVDSDIQMEQAAKGIDLTEALTAAIAVRAIGSGEYPLPGGLADTDALIRNHQSLQDFFQSVYDSGDFYMPARVGTEALSDPDVVVPSTPADFVGNFHLTHENGAPGTISTVYYQGVEISNGANGTGSFVMNLAVTDPATAWTMEGPGIRISHDHPYSYDNFPFINGNQVRETFALPADDLVRGARVGGRSIEGMISHATYTYPDNPEIPMREETSPSLSFSTSSSLPYTTTEVTSAPRVMKTLLPSTAEYSAPYGAGFFTFNANGAGHVTDNHYTNADFGWVIDAAGSIVVTYPSGDKSIYTRLDTDGSDGEGVMAEFQTVAGVNATYGLAAIASSAGAFTTSELSHSWASGLDLASTRIYDNDGQWFVGLDGPGQTGANVTIMPGYSFTRPLSWVIDDGAMYATYYSSKGVLVPYCDVGVDGCAAQYARRWTPIARDGNRIYVLEELYGDYDDDFHVTDDEMDTQRIMFYEIGSPYALLPLLNPAGPATPGFAPTR